MNSFMFENGKIFNKKSKTFEDGTICVSKGKIISGSNGVKEELKVIDCTGMLIAPGLIDLHVHVYHDVTVLGVQPDKHCLQR